MWPRDLCYVRYWRRNDDGSYGNLFCLFPCMNISLIGIYNFPIMVSFHVAVVLFRSREHENCGPQPGYVRAHIESKLLSFSTCRSIQGMRISWDCWSCLLVL